VATKASSGPEQQEHLRSTTCPICSTQNAREAYALPRFNLLVCANCTHLFSNLKVEPESYDADYFLESNTEHWDNPEETLFNRLDSIIQTYKPDERGNLRTLDVGTATGYLPRHFGALGYESCGLDISEEAVRYGTETLNIPRLQGADIENYIPEQPFPVITNIYVIEHVPDPVPFLEGIGRSLADDGIFICMTVDSDSLIFTLAKFLYRATGGRCFAPLERICEVHHLNHFNRKSLEHALDKAGFETIHRFHQNLPLRTLTLGRLQRLAVAVLYGISPLINSWFLQGVVCRRKQVQP
jgi:2-polyprenyl-3-methyl-5-hydroxy-6-metoxy-1,4-benzoquinol methylase